METELFAALKISYLLHEVWAMTDCSSQVEQDDQTLAMTRIGAGKVQ